MKRLFIGLYSVFLVNLFVMSSALVYANSNVISEGKAGGYTYTLMKEEGELRWHIGHNSHKVVITENKDNKHDLENFREAVQDSKKYKFFLLIHFSYLLLVGIIILIAYKKIKNHKKIGVWISSLFAIYAM